jgi:hypothetical protein
MIGSAVFTIGSTFATDGLGAAGDASKVGEFSNAADAAELSAKAATPHANSLNFPGENYGYQLTDKDTGTVAKFGETTNPRTRYSDQWLNSNNLQLDVLVYGSKEAIHDWQHQMILNSKSSGMTLPFNKSNW